MASGFSWSGGRPRCFAYWQEFRKCYAQTDTPRECLPQSNDYLECLHRPQETARARAIETELARKLEQDAKENKKTADALADGTVVSVGLIKRGNEESEQKAGAK